MAQAGGAGVWEESGPGDEHGPSGKDDMTRSHATYQPNEKEEKAIKLVYKKFHEGKKAKDPYDEHWLKWYKMFRGHQWTEQRPSYRHTAVINKIFQHIQSQVPQMVDTRPRVNYLAQEPSDQPFAELMNSMFTADWERNGWFNQLVEMLYDGHIYGTGLMEVGHDEDADYGRGRVTMKSFDPFWAFPEPQSRDVNNECEWWVTAEPMPVAKVRRDHPKMAKYIKADMHDLMGGDRQDFGKVRFKSPVDNRVVVENENQEEWANKSQVCVVTLYMRTKDIVEEKDDDGNYVQKLRYPKGRTIKVANGVLLEDKEELPYADDKFPYARWCNYMLPREFWGQSEVEQLEGPQQTFNKLVSFALDVLTLMGNPVWVVDHEAQVDTDNLFNRPGLVVEKAKGSEVRREEGVQLQPYVIQLINMYASWFDELGGSQDVSRGHAPAGITAMGAIEALQQAAHTRIRQKMRNMDITLNQIGLMYQARALEFYKAPQVFRITNDDNSQRYFAVNFMDKKNEKGDTIKVAQIKDFELDETGEAYRELPVKELVLNGQLDTRASAGSGLPFAMAEKEEKLLRLFDRGIIDIEEVLRGTDHPNWEAVLQRVTEQQAAQAQTQAPPA